MFQEQVAVLESLLEGHPHGQLGQRDVLVGGILIAEGNLPIGAFPDALFQRDDLPRRLVDLERHGLRQVVADRFSSRFESCATPIRPRSAQVGHEHAILAPQEIEGLRILRRHQRSPFRLGLCGGRWQSQRVGQQDNGYAFHKRDLPEVCLAGQRDRRDAFTTRGDGLCRNIQDRESAWRSQARKAETYWAVGNTRKQAIRRL